MRGICGADRNTRQETAERGKKLVMKSNQYSLGV
jgi:hypothetical protein